MGNYLLNAFRWSETVGPWEERPGHFNDAWGYWTDDGLGLFEFLQVSKTLLLDWSGSCQIIANINSAEVEMCYFSLL